MTRVHFHFTSTPGRPRSHLIFVWLVPPTSRLLLLSFPVPSFSFQYLVTRYGQLWMTRLGDPLSVFSSRSPFATRQQQQQQ